MAERRPLVVIAGAQQALPTGDVLPPSPLIADATVQGYKVPVAQPAITAGATLTIPLDGVPRHIVLTTDLSLDVTAPGLPDLGEVLLWLQQDATGGHTLALPETWNWPGATMGAVNLNPDGLTHLKVLSNPIGGIDAAVVAYHPV